MAPWSNYYHWWCCTCHVTDSGPRCKPGDRRRWSFGYFLRRHFGSTNCRKLGKYSWGILNVSNNQDSRLTLIFRRSSKLGTPEQVWSKRTADKQQSQQPPKVKRKSRCDTPWFFFFFKKNQIPNREALIFLRKPDEFMDFNCLYRGAKAWKYQQGLSATS